MQKRDLKNVLAISRSVLIACHIVSECEHLTQIELALSLDIKTQLTAILKLIIEDRKVDSMILDIVLEGLSYIWLKYPEKIIEQRNDIFKIVYERFQKSEVQNETKSMIL